MRQTSVRCEHYKDTTCAVRASEVTQVATRLDTSCVDWLILNVRQQEGLVIRESVQGQALQHPKRRSDFIKLFFFLWKMSSLIQNIVSKMFKMFYAGRLSTTCCFQLLGREDIRQMHHHYLTSLWDSSFDCHSFHTNAFLSEEHVCLRMFCTEGKKKKKDWNNSSR